MRTRFLLPLVIFVVVAVFLAVGLTRNPQEVPSPFIGKVMPTFELPPVQGGEATISPADFRGRVWLLNIWASWCVACRHEHPVLMQAAREHGLTIVGLDYKDERQDALDWLERHGDPYAVSAFDPEGRAGLDLGVYGVPETYVVDADGVIRYKHIGPITEQQFNERILPLVHELERAS